MIVVQCWTEAWILFEILPQASQACKWSSLRVLLCTWETFKIVFRAGQRPESRLRSSLTRLGCANGTSVHLGDVYDCGSVLDRGLDLV